MKSYLKRILVTASMTAIPFSLALASGASRTVELTDSARDVQLVDAQYDVIPTQVETRVKPGCTPVPESGENCLEQVIVASREGIRVNLSYVDRSVQTEGSYRSSVSVIFDTTDFSSEQVEQLKSLYPSWKHPFTNAYKRFAVENFVVTENRVRRPYRVVDAKRSKLCPVNGETGLPDPSCKEELVYKESWTESVVVTVSQK